jgi:hypothetical protein
VVEFTDATKLRPTLSKRKLLFNFEVSFLKAVSASHLPIQFRFFVSLSLYPRRGSGVGWVKPRTPSG